MKVTVLMNSYKEDKQIFIEAINSIYSNKKVDIQLILSTVVEDPCIKWVKKYPLTLVVNKEAGIYTQLNAMIPHIKGDYVTYSSSNDIMYPNKLYEECNLLSVHNKKVCYSAFHVGTKNNKKLNKFYDYDYKKHLKGNFVSDCAMVETTTFLKYMPFTLKYGNQAYYDLWLKIFENEGNVFYYNDSPTWLYIIRNTSQHIQRKKVPVKIKKNKELKILMLNERKRF